MGVVYHAHYLVWCDVARTDFIRELGTSYAELEREGLYLAVTEASIRYHAAARYDEIIRVQAWLERVQSRAVTFGYEITREEGAPARVATAATKLMALDRAGRPRAFPESLLRTFGAALENGNV
jgi:acyl-CoA thioester hydrolase